VAFPQLTAAQASAVARLRSGVIVVIRLDPFRSRDLADSVESVQPVMWQNAAPPKANT